MTDYPYEGQLIADPVTFQRATNAQVYVYDANDTTNSAPLALKDATGLPTTNPLTSSADAFVKPIYAPSQDIKYVGAGLTVFVSSAKGMRDAAAASAAAAQTAADSASTAAGNTLSTASVDGSGQLVVTKASGAQVNAGNVKGPKGDKGDTGAKGADGANVLPTDDAIKQAINDTASATRGALNATYAPALVAGKAPVRKGDLFVNVKDYGATGNGTTDDTAAIQAAAAALTPGSRMLFPPGMYVVSAVTNITVPCYIEGAGGGVNTTTPADVGVVIVNKTSSAGVFNCSANSIHFRRIYFVSYGGVAAATASQCTAITFASGDFCSVAECAFSGWYKWIWFQNCGGWVVRDNHFAQAAKYGIHIQNVAAPDTGDPVMTGNQLLSNSPWNAEALVRQESGGGLKVFGNKFFVTSTPGTLRFLDLAVADGAATSILLISTNSFEHAGVGAIRITQAGPSFTGTFVKVSINGNQFTCGSSTGPIIDIHGLSTRATDLGQIAITSNVFDGNGSLPASFVSIISANQVSVDSNQFYNGPVGVYIDPTSTRSTVSMSNSFFTVATPVSGPNYARPVAIPSGGAFTIDVPTPTNLTATAATSGGTLADGTYYYRVAYWDGISSSGLACAEVSATITGGGGSGKVTLAWDAWPLANLGVPRASIYKGTASGSENLTQNVSGSSFVDTGAGWSAGNPLPAANYFSTKLAPSFSTGQPSWILSSFFGINQSRPANTLEIGGSLGLRRDTVSDANYTANSINCIVSYSAITAARTVTLPTAVGVNSRVYIVKDESGNCSATNTITVQGTSGQTIDGAAAKVLSSAYGTIRLYSTGAAWMTF